MGEYEKAIKYYKCSLDIKRVSLGKNHQDVIFSYMEIAVVEFKIHLRNKKSKIEFSKID